MSNDELNDPVNEEHSEFMDMLDAEGVYLSGPVRKVDDNGVGWREEIIEDYPEIAFNNPLDNYNPEEHVILSDPLYFDDESDKDQILPSEYVMDDKILINKSDAVFLGIKDVVARGSMMEIMYAYMKDVPIFVWTMDGQIESGWVFDHAKFMSNDRNEVMREVKQWLST